MATLYAHSAQVSEVQRVLRRLPADHTSDRFRWTLRDEPTVWVPILHDRLADDFFDLYEQMWGGAVYTSRGRRARETLAHPFIDTMAITKRARARLILGRVRLGWLLTEAHKELAADRVRLQPQVLHMGCLERRVGTAALTSAPDQRPTRSSRHASAPRERRHLQGARPAHILLCSDGSSLLRPLAHNSRLVHSGDSA
ncbi:MAG: hypothetical protein ACI9MC_002488 [Kiritimatiellia bacterium]